MQTIIRRTKTFLGRLMLAYVKYLRMNRLIGKAFLVANSEVIRLGYHTVHLCSTIVRERMDLEFMLCRRNSVEIINNESDDDEELPDLVRDDNEENPDDYSIY